MNAPLKIRIVIVDGQVVEVDGLPLGASIEVWDYDIPGDWDEEERDENTRIDDAGDSYQSYTL